MEKTLNIVILDGFTANPGDLDWKGFEKFGKVTVYDRTLPEEVYERSRNADIIFTNKTPMRKDVIERLQHTIFIGILATGINVVDVKAAAAKKITVCNVPSYSTMSVAQNVFALLLEITNSVAHYSQDVKKGRWADSPDFAYTDTTLVELAGKKMGIVGFGAIGSRVALIAQALGMETQAFSSKTEEELFPTKKVSLEELFKTSDVISLHCPLDESTLHLVNRERIALMKPNAIIINTGRGLLIDEEALAEALDKGVIAAAGVDVLSQEPPTADNPLIKTDNSVITPHISWASYEARKRLLEVSLENLECFLAGRPINVVS